ncbi:spore germination protein GerW family protein [Streptomyces sp. NPDC017056]|uniref:spore germination protein GerW family protein n=1 Tax=Streptomyces sp. NPDC017056 TaxID=3364973 RepID=UPI003797FE26
MTTPDRTSRHKQPGPPADITTAGAAVPPLERLAEEISSRTSATVVYGEPVTAAGVTVIPVAEVSVGFGFGFGGGAERRTGTAGAGEGVAGGGVKARARGFVEIKDGTARYRRLRSPWLDAAVPLAALLTGIALPHLARRLAGRRTG